MRMPVALSLAMIGVLATASLSPSAAVAQGTAPDKIVSGDKLAAPAPGPDTGTRDLNRQAAVAAASQNDANANAAATYQQGVRDYEASRADVSRARADYEAAVAANRQARADYDAAFARWQADVAACNAGDTSHCGPTTPR